MKSSANVYNFVLLLVAVEFVCLSSGLFINHPNNITEAVGGNVTFTCATQGDDIAYIEWIVVIPAATGAKRFDTSSQSMVVELIDRGVVLGDLVVETNEKKYHINITIPAFKEHNNTEVRCRYYQGFDAEFSNPASLKILGPPSPPEPSLAITDPALLTIHWEPPFTWENHSISGYHVAVYSTSQSQQGVIPRWSTNTTTFHYSWLYDDELLGTRCEALTFSVTASSDIGESAKGNISGGFPILPGKGYFIDCESCHVYLQKNGQPQYRALIQLPGVCSYQIATFIIELSKLNNQDNNTVVIASSNYTGQGLQVPVTLDTDLTVNESYSLKVTVVTVAGNSTFHKNFTTEFAIPNGINTTGIEVFVLIGVVILFVAVGILAVTLFAIFLRVKRFRNNGMNKEINEAVTDNDVEGYYGVTGHTSHVYESVDDCRKQLKKMNDDVGHPKVAREVSPYQFMHSGFPKVSIKISESESTNSSLNEYVTTTDSQPSYKNGNDIETKLQVNNEANRVSIVTVGEDGGYTYMRSFVIQDEAHAEDELDNSFTQPEKV